MNSVKRFRDIDLTPQQWQIAGLVPKGEMTIVIGEGGSGKSTLVSQAILSVAFGLEFLGHEAEACKVLIVDYEQGEAQTARVLRNVARGMGLEARLVHDEPEQVLYGKADCMPLNKEWGVTCLQEAIQEHNIGMVVIDSLTVATAPIDPNAAEQVIPMMADIDGLGCTALIIDHVAKGGSPYSAQSSATTPFGSVFKWNRARSILHLENKRGVLTLTPRKANRGPLLKPHYLERSDTGKDLEMVTTFALMDPAEVEKNRRRRTTTARDLVREAVLALFEATRSPVPNNKIHAHLESSGANIKTGTINNTLSNLARDGKLRRDGQGYLPSEAEHPWDTFLRKVA